MISVDEALTRLLALATPLDAEDVALEQSHGRVLAAPCEALRDQPPFAASAMDGYAVAGAQIGAELQVIGTAQAGAGFQGAVGPGEAVRIFTGAPVPEGAARVILQEDVTRIGDRITIEDMSPTKPHIRPAGSDFTAGHCVPAGTVLTPATVALIAAMNQARVRLTRHADVVILPTGDELVAPGGAPRPDQIISSNGHGLAAMLNGPLAQTRLMAPVADHSEDLHAALRRAASADLIVTIGGASVGDHDLVAEAVAAQGGTLDFHRIRMRPGKPLMAGRLGQALLVGLPGNPVSALVTAHLFLRPLLAVMAGLPPAPPPQFEARLTHDLPANGPREHFMRGVLEGDQITVFETQDSGMLTRLAAANALIRRPVDDPARHADDVVCVLPF